MKKDPVILLVGVGAVGATIAAWLAPKYKNFYVLDQGDALAALRKQGVAAYLQHNETKKTSVPVNTIASFDELEAPDYVLLCVKNYSLHGLANAVKEKYGDNPVVVGLQNGIENQSVLPLYFSKAAYGVICYNAWLDQPAVAGFQKKGPIVFGTPNNALTQELNQLSDIFNLGVESLVTDHLQDAVLSKMIINLTNSFTTLVGFTYKPISDEGLFQKILTNLTYEGIQIAKAAGYKECKLGGMPSWLLITLSAMAPQWLTKGLFKKNVKKMVVSSMAQDVIQNKRGENELESINGYLLGLADKYGVSAPYNRAIYEICNAQFSNGHFEPMDVKTVWQEMKGRVPNLAAA